MFVCSGIIHVWVSMRPSIVIWPTRVRARDTQRERVWKSNRNRNEARNVCFATESQQCVHVNPIDSNFDIIEWNIGSKPKWIFSHFGYQKVDIAIRYFVDYINRLHLSPCHLFCLFFLHSKEWTDIIIQHKSNLIS